MGSLAGIGGRAVAGGPQYRVGPIARERPDLREEWSVDFLLENGLCGTLVASGRVYRGKLFVAWEFSLPPLAQLRNRISFKCACRNRTDTDLEAQKVVSCGKRAEMDCRYRDLWNLCYEHFN